jgi:ATP-binding cassette, subfamily F, member 3
VIQLSCLTKSFGDRVLLEDVTWQISMGERAGLCGPNGAGKTTLLKMLAGFDEPDSGCIIKPSNLTVGYLPQDGLVHAGRSILEEASSAFAALLAVKSEMHVIEERLAEAALSQEEHDALLDRYSTLQDRFRIEEGYSIDLKVATVLRGLGFTEASYDQPTDALSGGWQMRLAMAKLLLGRPTLLLLDEPTNHLDLDARNWVEEYLAAYPHAVILVSHDRFFLDSVVTRITDLNLRKLTDYPGNYTHYIAERDARMEHLRKAKREQEQEVARVRMFIDRFRYQATKAAQVQSRIKMLEKVVPIEAPPERKRIHFSFPVCAKSGRTILDLHDVRKAYGENVVFRNLNLHIERGDRLALVGPNGAGKSTLMRMLSGVEAPDTGTRREGHQVVMQYFAQDEAARLNPALTVYETLESGSPNDMVPSIRNILGGFLFSGDDVYKKVAVLSGGERTRLAVAQMLLRPSNTLLLDEPTNHLDLDSKDILLEALEDYGGTLIFVSHDRYFVEKLANKIVEVGHGHALVFPGTYPEFLWSKEHRGATGLPADSSADLSAVAPPGAKAEAALDAKAEARNAKAGPSDLVRSGLSRTKGSDGAMKVRHKPGPPTRQPRWGGNADPTRKVHTKKDPGAQHEARKRALAQQRKYDQEAKRLQSQIADLEGRIAECERAMKDIETAMSAPGFYDNRDQAQPLINRHQTLMWEVGDLMHQWEELQKKQRPLTESGC